MTVAIVLFAHGSRDPSWAAPFERLARSVARLRPEARVANAYLELMSPTLEAAVGGLIAEGIGEVVVVPLFLAPGGHVKGDLAAKSAQLRERHPGIILRVLPTLGEADALLDAMAGWIAASTR